MKKILLAAGILLTANNIRTMTEPEQDTVKLEALLNAMTANDSNQINFYQWDPASGEMIINLSNNNIYTLEELDGLLADPDLPKDVSLIDLSNNFLDVIGPKPFKTFKNLKYIRLNGNPIARIIKKGSPKAAQQRLKSLEAQFNRSGPNRRIQILL